MYYKTYEHFENFLRKNNERMFDLELEKDVWLKQFYINAKNEVSFYGDLFSKFTYFFRYKTQENKEKLQHIRYAMICLEDEKIEDFLTEKGILKKYDLNNEEDLRQLVAIEAKIYNNNYTEEFLKTVLELCDEHGIYFLYDENKTLVYIGKGTHLGKRMASSSKERKASYVRYLICNSLADMLVIELYLINKVKPKFNSDSKSDDKLTFKIDYCFEKISKKMIKINKENNDE